MKRPILIFALCSLAAVAQAQNATPVITNTIPDATVFPDAGPLVLDLTTFFQDQDLTKAARLTTVEGTMEFALYDRQKPITVTNFLRYVNEGRYQSSGASIFFHRSSKL
ncbi:MAG TPA: peptidylprolyl isomerase, partial [Chthoniobacterales bacterium]|nr:peptidylprolyl isomerase [Chthoniobacterales bacterium]